MSLSEAALHVMEARSHCDFEKATIRMITEMLKASFLKPDSKLASDVLRKDWDQVAATLRVYMTGVDLSRETGSSLTTSGRVEMILHIAKRADFRLGDLDGLVNKPRGWACITKWAGWGIAVAVLIVFSAIVFANVGKGAVQEDKQNAAMLAKLNELSEEVAELKSEKLSEGMAKLKAEKQAEKLAEEMAKLKVEITALSFTEAGRTRLANEASKEFQMVSNAILQDVGDKVASYGPQLQKLDKQASECKATVEKIAVAVVTMDKTVSVFENRVVTIDGQLVTSEQRVSSFFAKFAYMDSVTDNYYGKAAWFFGFTAMFAVVLGVSGRVFGEVAADTFLVLTASHDMPYLVQPGN